MTVTLLQKNIKLNNNIILAHNQSFLYYTILLL